MSVNALIDPRVVILSDPSDTRPGERTWQANGRKPRKPGSDEYPLEICFYLRYPGKARPRTGLQGLEESGWPSYRRAPFLFAAGWAALSLTRVFTNFRTNPAPNGRSAANRTVPLLVSYP